MLSPGRARVTYSSNQIHVFRVKRIPTFYPIQPFLSAHLPFPTACASDFTSQITYLLLYPHQRRPRLYIIYSLIAYSYPFYARPYFNQDLTFEIHDVVRAKRHS